MKNNKTERRLGPNTTHGLSHHPIYNVWESMIGRCCNSKNKDYKTYGGRGIKVCAEWRHNAQGFITWALKNGWQKGLQIDRINNDKGYFPNNCRFATSSESRLNSRLLQADNTSGFRGVDWQERQKKYRARAKLHGTRHHLGCFATAARAAKARDAFVIERGLHTPLNFPQLTTEG